MPGCETTSDTATRRPCFPWVALALCAASVGAAVWLWMRYSYCWDVAGKDLPQLRPAAAAVWLDTGPQPSPYVVGQHPLAGRYVRFRRELVGGADPCFFKVTDSQGAFAWLLVRDEDFPGKRHWAQRQFVGRIVLVSADRQPPETMPVIDITAGRLTGASIAGLVVGAWGTFVFVAAFLHWRRRRRAFGEAVQVSPEEGLSGSERRH